METGAMVLVREVERYIEREGLYNLVPSNRRDRPLRLGWLPALAWIGVLALVSAIPVYDSAHPSALFRAALANAVIICFIGFVLAKLLYDHFTSQHLKELDLLAVVLSSTGVGAVAGYFTGNLWAALVAALLAVALAVAGTLAAKEPFRLYSLLASIRLAGRTVRQSTSLLGVLMALGLALSLFASFTMELWSSLAQIHQGEMLFVVSLIFFPAFVLTAKSLKREAEAVTRPYVAGSDFNPGSLAAQVPMVLASTLGLDAASFPPGELDRARRRLAESGPAALDEIARTVVGHVKVVLLLLLIFSAMLLMLVLAVYFFFLFFFLFNPDDLVFWMQEASKQAVPPQELRYIVAGFPVVVTPATLIIAKVSIILGAFVSSITSIQALSDKAVHDFYADWLGSDVQCWLVMASLYRSLVPAATVRATTAAAMQLGIG
ncbi:MAG TPA: hypothetical protein VFJ16_01725 [Longimicrobium sp.]|nr:hypothetical protein [Longimicrobium sp.]